MHELRRTLERLMNVSRYSDAIARDRARLVYGMSFFLIIMFTLALFILRTADGTAMFQLLTSVPLLAFIAFFFYSLSALSIALTWSGRLTLGSLTLSIMWVVSLGFPAVNSGLYSFVTGIVLSIVIILPTLLNGVRGLLFGGLAVLGLMFFGLERERVLPPPQLQPGTDIMLPLLLFILLGGLAFMFLRYAQLSRSAGVSEAVRERLQVNEITAQINQQVARRISLAELLTDIVTRVSSSFDEIYHAQVFLIDAGGNTARLAASTGDVGQRLIAQQHNLPVGGMSVIGQVTFKGSPVIARTGSNMSSTIHRRNEFLPDTQAEAAIPLRIGDKIIGALDLQSREVGAFQAQMMEAFSSLADGIALAIDNVRQFERAEARVLENQQLVEQARNALREVERLNERLTGRAWTEYLRGRDQEFGLDMDLLDNRISADDVWTATMAEAIKYNHFVQEQQDKTQVIAVPLRVRGQIVGAMEFEIDDQHSFSPEDMTLMQEVGERFGLAAENTRLVEESQRSAQREALVNEISSRLQVSNNVETTLTEAARSLQEVLKASKVAIRLGTPPNGA